MSALIKYRGGVRANYSLSAYCHGRVTGSLFRGDQGC